MFYVSEPKKKCGTLTLEYEPFWQILTSLQP